MRILSMFGAALSAAIIIAPPASASVVYSSEAFEGQATGDLPTTANDTDYFNTGNGTTNVKVVGNLDDGNPGTADPIGQHVRIAGDVNKHITLTNPMTLATDGVESLRVDFAIHFDKGGYTLEQNGFELLYSASGDFTDTVMVQRFSTVDNGTIPSGPYEYLQNTWYPGQSVKIDATALGTTFTDTAKLRWRKRVNSSGNNSYVYLDDVVITSVAGAPQLDATTPVTSAIGIQRNANLWLTFDEDVLAVAGKFITLHQPNGTAVETVEATSAAISGRQVTIPLTTDLGLGNSYYVTVDAGAFTDLSTTPYAGITDPAAWTFTTTLADITYVDAIDGESGNTFATGGSLADLTWLIDPGTASASQTQWSKRTGVEGNDDTLYQARHSVAGSDEMPELTTRISGLADGTYRVWAFYWDQVVDDNQNWTISTGLNSGSLFSYASPGEPTIKGTTTANITNAANLSFTNSVVVEAAFDGSAYVRNLLGVDLGEVTVSGGTSTIDVFVDNLVGNDSINRTWYDGVGYQLVANPTAADPRITSFTAIGNNVWELTLQADADTNYEFHSSTTLEFTPGTLLGLTQENPGSDPGTVDGSGNFVTTDGTGAAKLRITLTGATRDFVRARTTP